MFKADGEVMAGQCSASRATSPHELTTSAVPLAAQAPQPAAAAAAAVQGRAGRQQAAAAARGVRKELQDKQQALKKVTAQVHGVCVQTYTCF